MPVVIRLARPSEVWRGAAERNHYLRAYRGRHMHWPSVVSEQDPANFQQCHELAESGLAGKVNHHLPGGALDFPAQSNIFGITKHKPTAIPNAVRNLANDGCKILLRPPLGWPVGRRRADSEPDLSMAARRSDR